MSKPKILQFLFVMCCLLTNTGTTAAQEDVTPIALGQPVTAAVTAATPIIRFAVTNPAGESVQIQVFSLTSDYFPTLRVLSPSGIERLSDDNEAQDLIVDGIVTLGEPGAYVIEVGGRGETRGQFVLSVQPGPDLPVLVDLVAGQPVEAAVDSEQPIQRYRFQAAPDETLRLTLVGLGPDTGSLVSVQQEDETAVHVLSSSVLSPTGLRVLTYDVTPGAAVYVVEVAHSGSPQVERVRLCLGTTSAPAGCEVTETPAPAPEATLTPGLSSAESCEVLSATGGPINVRSGPSTGYGIIASLVGDQSAEVIGQFSDGSWYQLGLNGQVGWVAASVARLVGGCAGLPVVSPPAPAIATAAATATAIPTTTQPTSTTAPGATATAAPPTLSPTLPPTESPTLFPTMPVFEVVDTRPDLTLGSFYYGVTRDSNGTPVEPKAYSIGITMVNNGATSSGPYTLRMCRNGECFDYPYPGLEAGQARLHQVDFSPAFTGMTVPFVFAIDFYNDVDESTDTNNLFSTEVTFDP